jgi:hypothetical protein
MGNVSQLRAQGRTGCRLRLTLGELKLHLSDDLALPDRRLSFGHRPLEQEPGLASEKEATTEYEAHDRKDQDHDHDPDATQPDAKNPRQGEPGVLADAAGGH